MSSSTDWNFCSGRKKLIKLQPHLPVVEIALIVEDKALHAHALSAADRRPHADIRDGAVLAAVVEIHLRGIHAVARHEHPSGNCILIVGVPIFVPRR